MKPNKRHIKGVLHQHHSEKHYQLRRYLPDQALLDMVEQFWFVDWDLHADQTHTQQNLPDPNFHLVYDKQELKVIGPVSKTYAYTMRGKGQILGVKFKIGAHHAANGIDANQCIDKEFDVEQFLPINAKATKTHLAKAQSDEDYVSVLQNALHSLCFEPSKQLRVVWQIMTLIKNEHDILKVEHISRKVGVPVRTIQRYFQVYVGLSPKWLIRKHRLQHFLSELDASNISLAELMDLLGYTDQSHLIHDFKSVLGVTPRQYMQQHSQ